MELLINSDDGELGKTMRMEGGGMSRQALLGSGLFLFLILTVIFSGCASSGESYINPDIDFGFMERAAVLPFENRSSDNLADERLHSVFLMEILKEDVLEIVDVGETASAMRSMSLGSGSKLTPEQAVALGERLGVDALFFGIVEEYGVSRVDRKRGPEVTAVFGMTETQTGSLVWRSQVNVTGSSTWKRIIGGTSSGMYEVSQEAVRKALRTLL
jgi:hypothetical protein